MYSYNILPKPQFSLIWATLVDLKSTSKERLCKTCTTVKNVIFWFFVVVIFTALKSWNRSNLTRTACPVSLGCSTTSAARGVSSEQSGAIKKKQRQRRNNPNSAALVKVIDLRILFLFSTGHRCGIVQNYTGFYFFPFDDMTYRLTLAASFIGVTRSPVVV